MEATTDVLTTIEEKFAALKKNAVKVKLADPPEEIEPTKKLAEEADADPEIDAQTVVVRKKAPSEIKHARKVKRQRSKSGRARLCGKRNCETKLVNNHRKWCAAHAIEVRKAQTKRNNQIWRARKRAGKAGHHAKYAGKPTKWAKARADQPKLKQKKGKAKK